MYIFELINARVIEPGAHLNSIRRETSRRGTTNKVARSIDRFVRARCRVSERGPRTRRDSVAALAVIRVHEVCVARRFPLPSLSVSLCMFLSPSHGTSIL